MWLSRFMLVCIALVLGCTTTQPTTTKAPLPTSSPCETVMQTYCAKGDQCQTWPFAACYSVMGAACGEIIGITATEAAECSSALLNMPCDADSLPGVCISIGSLRGGTNPAPVGVSL